MVGRVGFLDGVGLIALAGAGTGGSLPVDVPENTIPPTIVWDGISGSTITLDYGTWTGDITSYSVVFKRDTTSVQTYPLGIGAPDPTRTGGASDYGVFLTLEVTATGPGGSTTVTSAIVFYATPSPVIFDSNWDSASAGTNLRGYSEDGFTWAVMNNLGVDQPADTALRITDVDAPGSGNDIYCYANGSVTGPVYHIPANLNSGEWEFQYKYDPAWSTVADTLRYFVCRHQFSGVGGSTIYFEFQRNLFNIYRRLNNVSVLIGSQTGLTTASGTIIKFSWLEDGGNVYVNVTIGGVKSSSFAANAGRGFLAGAATDFPNNRVGTSGFNSALHPDLHSGNWKISGVPANMIVPVIGTVIRSPDDADKMRVPLTGYVTGAVTSIEWAAFLNGVLVYPWTAGAALSANNITDSIDINTIDGGNLVVVARQIGNPAYNGSTNKIVSALPLIIPLDLWINAEYSTQWAAGNIYNDQFYASEWRLENYNAYVMPRGKPATGLSVATSADGEGGTVQMDDDGRIYGYNTVGATKYRFIGQAAKPKDGTCRIDMGGPLPITMSVTPSGWSYNPATGIGTFPVVAGMNTAIDFLVNTSDIPPGGLKPTLKMDGSGTGVACPEWLANVQMIAGGVRWLTPSGTNSAHDFVGRTPTQTPVRTPALRSKWKETCSEIAAAITEEGHLGAWWNQWHIDDDATVAIDADNFAAKIASDRKMFVELCNEQPWNFYRNACDVKLLGLRRGYGPDAITYHDHPSRVTETIVDSIDRVGQSSGITSAAFTAGERIFVERWGTGFLVYDVTANIAAGYTIPLAGDANFVLRYTNAQTFTAGLRFMMRRTKEVVAIWKARFALVGKENCIVPILTYQAGGDMNNVRNMLDFDDGYLSLAGGHVCAAYYWGGGVAGPSLGQFTATGPTGWVQANKEKIYTNMPGALTDYFSVVNGIIDQTITLAANHAQFHVDYLVEKGQPKDLYTLGQYESSYHDTEFGWPDMCGTYNDEELPYKTFKRGSDGATYQVSNPLGCPANTAPPNATYWTLYWNTATSDTRRAMVPRPIYQFFEQSRRDQRMGDAVAYYYNQWEAKIGGPVGHFDKTFAAFTSSTAIADAIPFENNGITWWGIQRHEGDNDISGGAGTNWQLKALFDKFSSL